MKLLLASLLCFSALFGAEHDVPYVQDCPEYLYDSLISLAFEQPGKELFELYEPATFQSVVYNPKYTKKILVVDNQIAGFVILLKEKEISYASWAQNVQSGVTFSLDSMHLAMFLPFMPHVKQTEFECQEYARIEGFAIAQRFKNLGYEGFMLDQVIQWIHTAWPLVRLLEVDVETNDPIMKAFYTGKQFISSQIQPIHTLKLPVTQYERAL